MINRFLGHYSLTDIFGVSNNLDIENYLPNKNKYFFHQGRHALYNALVDRKRKSSKKYVIISGWTCPLIQSIIKNSGFEPIIVDIEISTLHYNFQNIRKIINKYDVDTIICISENGYPYSNDEILKYKELGLSVIADYAIGWHNIFNRTDFESDYEIFSGGFSKPISGLGLGILTTKHDITLKDTKESKIEKNLIMILIHILLENPFLYNLAKNYIPNDLQTDFVTAKFKPSNYSLNIVKNSIVRYKNLKLDWMDFQEKLIEKFYLKNIKSNLNRETKIHNLTKILIPRNEIGKTISKKIEFHKQYTYDFSKYFFTPKKLKNINNIRNNYLSFTINYQILKRKEEIINEFI